VILGCTHYPLVRPILQRTLGRRVEIITSGAPLARQVEHVLGARGLENPRDGEGDYSFLCTGDTESFHALGTRFLQMPLGAVRHIEIGAPAQPGREGVGPAGRDGAGPAGREGAGPAGTPAEVAGSRS
jgi:glutamate racemase